MLIYSHLMLLTDNWHKLNHSKAQPCLMGLYIRSPFPARPPWINSAIRVSRVGFLCKTCPHSLLSLSMEIPAWLYYEYVSTQSVVLLVVLVARWLAGTSRMNGCV